MDEPKASRRWLQFTLRAALLVMLVVAAFLGGRASTQSERDRLSIELRHRRDMAAENAALQSAYDDLNELLDRLRSDREMRIIPLSPQMNTTL